MAALLGLILDCFHEKKPPATMLEAAKAMVDASSTPIVLCDAEDGSIVHCNLAWTNSCGYSIVEAFGRTNKELLQGPETDAHEAKALVRELRATTSSRRVLRNYRKDGTPFWNDLILQHIGDEATSQRGEGLDLAFVQVAPSAAGVACESSEPFVFKKRLSPHVGEFGEGSLTSHVSLGGVEGTLPRVASLRV
jgi:PAS domain S-box-containing protein